MKSLSFPYFVPVTRYRKHSSGASISHETLTIFKNPRATGYRAREKNFQNISNMSYDLEEQKKEISQTKGCLDENIRDHGIPTRM